MHVRARLSLARARIACKSGQERACACARVHAVACASAFARVHARVHVCASVRMGAKLRTSAELRPNAAADKLAAPAKWRPQPNSRPQPTGCRSQIRDRSQMGAELRPNARECVSGASHPGRAVHLEEARRKIENAANLGIARKRASVVKLQSEKSALIT